MYVKTQVINGLNSKKAKYELCPLKNTFNSYVYSFDLIKQTPSSKRHQNYFIVLLLFVGLVVYRTSSTQLELSFSKSSGTTKLQQFGTYHLLLPISNYLMSNILIRFLADHIWIYHQWEL